MNYFVFLHRDDFTAYADVCFREFGDRVSYWTTLNEPNVDRVSYWTTLNEPNVVAVAGYDSGTFPRGNSVFEPCIAAHNFLLGHSSAYALYKRKYRVNFILAQHITKRPAYHL